MAALEALDRALRKGTETTRPDEDAARIARVAASYGLPATELREAAAEIRDWTRRPSQPLAARTWRVLGDPGADILELAARLLDLGQAAG